MLNEGWDMSNQKKQQRILEIILHMDNVAMFKGFFR